MEMAKEAWDMDGYGSIRCKAPHAQAPHVDAREEVEGSGPLRAPLRSTSRSSADHNLSRADPPL